MTGWIAGWYGLLIKTTDGGNTWKSQYKIYGQTTTFNKLFFINENTGWVVGSEGKIFHTTNGGYQWVPQNSGTSNDLYEINFSGPDTGWICRPGYLIRTTNSGNTWIKLLDIPIPGIYGLWFVSPNLGWGVGYAGAILKYDKELTNVSSIESYQPESFRLYQNYPNPFNPVTIITYECPSQGFVTLKVFGISGKHISTLVNEYKQPGKYQIEFDGKDLPSGIYFCQFKQSGLSDLMKMILLK
jgi:photosystem II stability/assembly factor-like uncharacterized protein